MTHPIPPTTHRLNTLRHPEADYSDPGVYFITLCTKNKNPLFGSIVNYEMRCNRFGVIVWDIWKSLPKRYAQISIDAAIVMPDHFHGIIIINENLNFRGDTRIAPNWEVHEPPLQTDRRNMTIPLIIGYLKMNTAKRINFLRNTPGEPVWQRNFFDKILRADQNYESLTEYIFTNPTRWGIDID